MNETAASPLVLHNRHTGERLQMRRISEDGQVCLALQGALPAGQEGPPLHIHFREDEEVTVVRGTLSALVDGRRMEASVGESVRFPAGSLHRWWNEGDEELELVGVVRPLVDLDRLLHSVFDVLNASDTPRPSPIYMAHLALRFRHTQAVIVMPRPVQAVLFRIAYLIGKLTGRYSGSDWPGSPETCTGAPTLDGADT